MYHEKLNLGKKLGNHRQQAVNMHQSEVSHQMQLWSEFIVHAFMHQICKQFVIAFYELFFITVHRNIEIYVHKSLFSESAFEVSRQYDVKLCFETKSTKLGVGHFMSISGHFFANFLNSFHKIEVLTVILMGPTCQNLIWIKSYNINHKVFYFLLFSIL